MNSEALLEAARAILRKRPPGSEILLIAPVRSAADDLARSVCDTASAGIRRFTLEGLAAELSSHLLAVPVTRIVREALAARVTSEALREGKLVYFAPVATMRGFAPALARTLLDLRMHSADRERLIASGPWGQDLALLLACYERELRDAALADRATRFQIAIEVLTSGAHHFAQSPAIALNLQPRYVLECKLLDACKGVSQFKRTPIPTANPESALQSLQQHLFSDQKAFARQDDESFAIFSASGEALECVEIARRLLERAELGTPFDRMAVLLRRPERYGPMVAEAFRRASIPAYFAQSAALPDPNGRALLALLHCAAEGLSAARFAEYLSLGQLPEGTPPHYGWERLLNRASVMGGSPQRWARRFGSLEPKTEALDHLRNFALPIVERLAAFPEDASWGEWLQSVRDLAQSTLRDADTVVELLDELQPMEGIGPVHLASILLTLEDRLRFLRRAPEQERYGCVFVGAIEDARGMSFHSVFLPGVNEGAFPARVREDPLFLDERRRAAGVPAALDDNELLCSAVAAATSHLSMSYSRIDLVTGRSRVPSFYVFEAYQAALGRTADVQSLQAAARDAVETRIDWPAPADPERAIDDLEFDLALLKPAFADGTPGAASYLGELNKYAVQSLRARYRRWSNAWRHADGFVQMDEGEMGSLRKHRLTVRSWTPSDLEEFAVCPYRFALRGILRLQPMPIAEPPQRMDPSIRGLLYHRTVSQFLKGDSHSPEELDRILNLLAALEEERLAPAIPPVWHAEVESLRTDLQGWLRTRSDGQWRTLHSEWEFKTTIWGQYLLHGAADMVEKSSFGPLRITDLKTGALPKWKPTTIGKGEMLQPALYAAAVEAVLGEAPASTRLHFATLRRNYAVIEVPVRASQRDAKHVLDLIDKSLDAGFLPAAPREEACLHCDYLPICGPYEEERVQRKPPGEMRDLRRIRSIF